MSGVYIDAAQGTRTVLALANVSWGQNNNVLPIEPLRRAGNATGATPRSGNGPTQRQNWHCPKWRALGDEKEDGKKTFWSWREVQEMKMCTAIITV